jgi:carbon monoxide dehydrogenase subunit G
MKIIKIILVCLVILILGFFSLGLFVPSYEYQNSITVAASPQKCWDTFHNTSLMSQWMDGFESISLKSGEHLVVGSTYEIIINSDNERMVMLEKLLQIKAPEKVTYQLDNDVLKSEYIFSFEGAETTTITSRYKITGANLIWRSVLFLSKSYMADQSQAQLDGLKKVIENQK